MGWSGGTNVVQPVVEGLMQAVEADTLSPASAEDVLHLLIKSCQDADWDSEGDVLDEYQDIPWVVEAFKRAEFYLVCGESIKAESLQGHTMRLVCELPRGHTVDHRDEDYETEWPLATGGN